MRAVVIGCLLIVTLGFTFPSAAFAADRAGSTYQDENGLAIAGYDVVAYAQTGKAVPGKMRYRSQYRGSVYAFASKQNQTTFGTDPDSYLPAYGGYCSYGVRLGRKSPVNPALFEVINGKVYLFLNQATKFAWEENRGSNKKLADKNWSKMTKGH